MDEVSIGEFARRARLSVKALRLYDELGVLVPIRVDSASGYRYYDVAQLDDARLVAMMREVGVPLATVKELLVCEPAEAAERLQAYWRDTEATHRTRRDLVDHLLNLLGGKKSMTMYEVSTRDMPQRSVLCAKRNVDEKGAWAFGKEFITILRERPVPRIPGREGAMFCIYWGHVSADSDGPVEWCMPVPDADASALAEHYPELMLRTEPAHREAFVSLAIDAGGSEFQLASEALRAWALEQGVSPQEMEVPPDLGMRITYLATPPITAKSVPDCDFAVPFIVPAGSRLAAR